MFLQKLELQGFKTFAKKTTFTLLPPQNGVFPLTAVVGANGSGKSNAADAIRWALGEQSLKLLRGKKGEDVIFSGSTGRGRAGFAEVSLTFNNEDRAMPIDYAEVTITRRLFRDGESEYLLNGHAARLSDIQLLLAQANVGQRSYSVVGQGMVDHILVSTPEERKVFFDDATGVRQFQIKRHDAMLKLKRTYENLSEVEMVLREIEPRMKSLERQVKRLEQRETMEEQLRDLQRAYYGTLWWNLEDELAGVARQYDDVDGRVKAAEAEGKELESRVTAMEVADRAAAGEDAGLSSLRQREREAQRKRNTLRDEEFETQKKIELEKVRAQASWTPLPLDKIIGEVDGMVGEHERLMARLKDVKEVKEVKEVEAMVDDLLKRSSTLSGRLKRPAPEDMKADPALLARLKELADEKAAAETELRRLESEIDGYAKKEQAERTELFAIQRELRQKQQQVHLIESQRHSVQIDLARLEERRNNLAKEIDQEMKEDALSVKTNRVQERVDPEQTYPELQKYKYKLELIGGIDPEIMKEYSETKERYDFLHGQVEDLRQAMTSTEKIVDELDGEIEKLSQRAFRDINREFQRYFKILFGGGSCSLVKMTREEVAQETASEVSMDRPSSELAADAQLHIDEEEDAVAAFAKRIKEREDRVVGIDIQATPPGKKLKALNLLSGGERALTSIALLAAIMATNPAPFVVLDEVDAALDESNTLRFAEILKDLQKRTQYIVVTHNRATMEHADIIYGVTMGDDGVSNLLSINLAEIETAGTARR